MVEQRSLSCCGDVGEGERGACFSNREHGFTLVEALLSVVILAFLAVFLSGLFAEGVRTVHSQEEQAVLDSHLRGRMELLLSAPFDQLTSGSGSIIANGQTYPISWTVDGVDLDGDGLVEADIKKLAVTLQGRTLSTLVLHHNDRLGTL